VLLTLAALCSLYTVRPASLVCHSLVCHSNEAIAGAFSEDVEMSGAELGLVGDGPLYRTVCITGGERERGILEIVSANLRRRERSRPYEVAVRRREGAYFLKIEVVEDARYRGRTETAGKEFFLRSFLE
jgi:hypothetical protein